LDQGASRGAPQVPARIMTLLKSHGLEPERLGYYRSECKSKSTGAKPVDRPVFRSSEHTR
jgi:hypothetical protein